MMSKNTMTTGIPAGYDDAFVVMPSESIPLPSYHNKAPTSVEAKAAEPEKENHPVTCGSIVTNFADSTTAHGVARIANASSCFASFLWLVILCVAFGGFFFQGTNLVLDFFSWPYGTTIDIITNTSVDFPAVTVCNMNRLRRSKLPGTRFEGVIAIDGGISGGDNDYSWFFEWSSAGDFYNQFVSASAGGGSSGGGGGSSAGGGGSSAAGSSYSYPPASSNYYYWETEFGDDFNFEYDNYYDFGTVTGESDWDGFLANSKSEDFSDIINVANPTQDEMDELGHQAEDFILQCTFDRRKCNYTDFYKFQNSHYGNCFTFNHGRNETVRTTSKSGFQYGLHLTLFIEQPEYVGLFSPESGVRVSINHWQTTPHPEDSGITATTGQATSIALRKNFIKRLGGWYSNCTYGTETNFTSDFFTYSPLTCKKQCMQRNLKDRCDCVTDLLLDGEKCSYLNSTQQRCRQLVEALYEEDKLDCLCPVACEENVFKTSASVSIWPSERYEEHLYSRLSSKNAVAARMLQDVETTRKNLARVRIYFEELNYQKVEQIPQWTIESILGAVGGLMGLYVGISSITLMEIIVFVFSLLKQCCKSVICLNKVQPSN